MNRLQAFRNWYDIYSKINIKKENSIKFNNFHNNNIKYNNIKYNNSFKKKNNLKTK